MKIVKCLLIFFVFGLFGIQAIQSTMVVFPQGRLTGVRDSTRCPAFSREAYNSRSFQTTFETHVEEKMGFRNAMVRLRNQFDYSVFRYTDSPIVVFGKNGILLTKQHIWNHTGSDFKGLAEITNNVRRLKIIQDELKKHNVDFLLFFSPGKIAFYSELIPDYYMQRPATNYEYYKKALEASGINFIDMNSWFKKLKGKTRYPLYPRNGAHWSSYGICIGADSIFRYIEKLRKIDLPEFWWDKVILSDTMRFDDNDIGELLNIWAPLKQDPMPYFHFQYNQEGKTRPHVIAIGDSYWLGFTELQITENVFAFDSYWNYFNFVMINNRKTRTVADLDLKQELYSQDVVILTVTESNYQVFPFGFIDAFFEKCLPGSPETLRMTEERFIKGMKTDPKWYQFVAKKARENGVTTDEQIIRDAQYMVELEKNKK